MIKTSIYLKKKGGLMPYKDIKCGVYLITNNINNKKYVGISNNIQRRWNEHKNHAINPKKQDDKDKALYNATRKHGIENFSLEIIEECSKESLKEREIYWIQFYDSYKKGYNETYGGDYIGEKNKHYGENHPLHIFTLEEVKMCRELYKKGIRSMDVYREHFQKKGIKPGAFLRMWHGKSWGHINPEVFENNPHPRKKVVKEDIEDIQRKFEKEKVPITQIAKEYKGKYGYGTVWDIAHHKRGF